jgi:hypothetical protein
MKIRQLEPELFHADGRTDTNLMVAFRNFANAPKSDRDTERNGEQFYADDLYISIFVLLLVEAETCCVPCI